MGLEGRENRNGVESRLRACSRPEIWQKSPGVTLLVVQETEAQAGREISLRPFSLPEAKPGSVPGYTQAWES